jgi:hypothetical protein
MKFWNGMGACFAAIALSMMAGAQTTAPATCTTAPTSLTALDIERVVPLANVLTTLTPNAPANVLAGIAGGALEIHETLGYNAQLNAVTSTVFVVPAGSPLPTPAGGITAQNVVQLTTINITNSFFSCSPTPSVLLVGTVAGGPTGVYGSFVGAPAAVSIGYTTATPPAINNVAVVISGVAVEYSTSAVGILTFPAATSTGGGGGTGSGSLTAAIKLPNGSFGQSGAIYQIATSPLLLDASASSGGTAPLTYKWSSNNPVAFVQTGNPATIHVQFPGPGAYAITLTATDAAGNTNSVTLTFEYVGQPF